MATALIQLLVLLAAPVAFAGPLTRRLEDWTARRALPAAYDDVLAGATGMVGWRAS